MKVAIYARTSTEEQHPENQVNELKEYAQRCGHEVSGVYVDYISGAKESRPQLDLLMQDARQKKCEAVLIWKLDRLGRSLPHLIHILEEWHNRGIGLICMTQNIDTTTPAGKLVFHIFGAIAEFERELVKERIKLSIQTAPQRR
jgi:Site-specific recombinases, DNA invertase Pin homologs